MNRLCLYSLGMSLSWLQSAHPEMFQKGVCPDLLATSGDYLRIWKVSENSGEVKLESLLNNVSVYFNGSPLDHADVECVSLLVSSY